jgi:Tfp pilus assembly major pilin PilA
MSQCGSWSSARGTEPLHSPEDVVCSVPTASDTEAAFREEMREKQARGATNIRSQHYESQADDKKKTKNRKRKWMVTLEFS